MEEIRLLVTRAQQGDMNAFGHLVRRFQDMALTLARRQLHDSDLAQDAVQDAFLEAYLHLPQLRQPIAFPGWFRQILLGRCSRLLRDPWLHGFVADAPFPEPASTPDPLAARETREEQGLVRRAIAALPMHDRQIISLYYLGGHSIGETARMLGLSESATKKRLHDARRRLGRWLAARVDGYLDTQRRALSEEDVERLGHGRFLINGDQLELPPGASGCLNGRLYTLSPGSTDLEPLTDPGTYLNPRPTPDGRKLVFGAGRIVKGRPRTHLCQMNPDGTGLEVLEAEWINELAFSPDGRQIAFTSDRDQHELPDFVRGELYLMDADGSPDSIRRLTHNHQAEMCPQWTPDGRILFARYLRGGTSFWGTALIAQLFTIHPDGTGETPFPPGGPPVYSDSFRYSPDGRRIAYLVSYDRPNAQNLEIWVMETSGANQRRLLAFPAPLGGLCWSPDGQQLAFCSNYQGIPSDAPEYNPSHPLQNFYLISSTQPAPDMPSSSYPGVPTANLAAWMPGC